MQTSNQTHINLEIAQLVHDLRSPLQALKGISSGMVPNEKLANDLLKEASTRFEELIGDLSKLSKRKKSDLKEFDVFDLINSTINMKYVEYPYRRFKISIRNKCQSTKVAQLDPKEFKRVISNLLNNAIESLGEQNGKILITLKEVDNQIHISIKDNGHGIPQELITHITGLGHSYGKENGTGLGLYHAKNSIESWNGSLNIESLLSIGTIVSLSLPTKKAPRFQVVL